MKIENDNMIVHNLKALLWKQWCIFKNHYFKYSLCILIPWLLCSIIFILDTSNKDLKAHKEPQVIFPVESFKDITQKSSSILTIVYAPSNPTTDRVMKHAEEMLKELPRMATFRGLPTVDNVTNWFASNASSSTREYGHEGYGVIFNEMSNATFNYSIRSSKVDAWHTNLKFPMFTIPGPMEVNVFYAHTGFTALQMAINQAYSTEVLGTSNLNYSMQEFPYPEYAVMSAIEIIYQTVVPAIYIFGYLFLSVSVIDNVVNEKRSGIRELLKLNGLQMWQIYVAWLVFYLILSAISIIGVTILLTAKIYVQAVLSHSNPLLVAILGIIYCLANIIAIFAFSSLFTDAVYASLFAFCYYGVSLFVLPRILEKVSSNAVKFLLCFLPVGGGHEALGALTAFETSQEGLNFSNLFSKPPSSVYTLPVIVVFFGMLLSCLLYLLLTYYVDRVKPGPFGRADKWNFFIPKFNRKDGEVTPVTSAHSTKPPLLEDLPKNTPIGLRLDNITKYFGKFRAVNGLSLDIYSNQITALLGHNGAGKTTTMSIITGMYSPTAGTVYVDGANVFDDLEGFRKDLGLCTQDDLLLDELTVREHIVFFGLIKGLSTALANEDANKLMTKFGILEKKDNKIGTLSGGMKRKVCLSIALVGDPKILLLDEPTSGLDPESRREIWDILLSVRGNRTIIITTHFMEEADVLGDKIAIMAQGELRCYGSSIFLKNKFGSGYQLTVTLKEKMNPQKIFHTVEEHIPTATVESLSNEKIVIKLPFNAVNKFSTAIRAVEDQYDGKVMIGIACATMDDVFLKIQEDEGVSMKIDEVDMPTLQRNFEYTRGDRVPYLWLWLQIYGIMVKRFSWALQNWFMLALKIVLLPLILTYFALSLSSQASDATEVDTLSANLKLYEGSEAYYYAPENSVAGAFFKAEVESQGSTTVEVQSNLVQALLSKAKQDETFYRTQMVVAANFSSSPVVMYSTLAYHSPMIAVNLMSNAMINSSGSKARITTYNDPYEFNSSECDLISGSLVFILSAWLSIFGVAITMLNSYFAVFPHQEIWSIIKHLQIMTGLSPITYWISNFVVDILLHFTSILLIMLLVVTTDNSQVFDTCTIRSAFFLILILYGPSSIFLAYWVAYLFKNYTNVQTVIMLGSFAAAILAMLFPYFLSDFWANFFTDVAYLIPFAPFSSALITILKSGNTLAQCSDCISGQMKIMCDILKANNTIAGLGIDKELYFLAFDFLFYLALMLLSDYGFFSWLWNELGKLIYGPITSSFVDLDPNVVAEKDKVDAARTTISSQSIENRPLLITDGLGKKFNRKMTAVHDVSFTVTQGECFGLLGVNGAGKTTTFRMITGMTRPSKGDAIIDNFSLSKSKFKFLQRQGYCPQSGGLIPDLSARQQLCFFARLRGVPPSQLNSLVDKWIKALEMREICDRPCGLYSGGNKRKLSTALAFIGDPPLILLDEPTTGVDPVLRRKMWLILKKCQSNGQTIVITSHSMDECEAVCDRLTIMVHGYMKCLGPINELKKTYGKGYTLQIKLRGGVSEALINELKSDINRRFTYVVLKGEQAGLLTYHIQNTASLPLSSIFNILNELSSARKDVMSDFMVNDTSLEEVFLSFARNEQSSEL